MLLCGTARLHDIISLKSRLNYQLMSLRQKLIDLQQYSASIGDGTVSADDLMNAPASMFQKMSIFMAYSDQFGRANANQNIGTVMAMNQQNMTQMPPALQQQYQQMAFINLYNQGKEKLAQQETKRLNVEEAKMEKEKSQLETQLQMLEAEEKSTKEAVDAAAKDSAPKYVA